MSGGFWAGAVPPWAWVVGGCLGVLLVLLGVWAGYGRGWKHAEEDERWAREQAKARRTHPVYRQPPELTHEEMFPWAGSANTATAPTWLAHEDQSLTLANGPMWEYRAEHPQLAGQVIQAPAITTGEIQAITAETDVMVARLKTDNDLWMAEHGLSDS